MRAVDVSPAHVFGAPDEDGIAGESYAVWLLRAALAAAALLHCHVLLLGESGTGKELAARSIYRQLRRKGAFQAGNAATLGPGIASAELFGNIANFPNQGSPARPGWVGAALGGCLLLDEIGDAPEDVQAKLLRLMQGEYMLVGDSKVRLADIIVIGATNRPVTRLKSDLVPRFDVVVELPSLAARREDIPFLALAIVQAIITEAAKNDPGHAERFERFVKRDAKGRPYLDISQSFSLALMRATFPGNVRDLRKVLLRAMTDTAEGPLQQPVDMAPWQVPPSLPPPPQDPAIAAETEAILGGIGIPPREILELELIRQDWNLTATGKVFRTDRFQIKRWMDRYGLQKPQ
jgi:two-component system nitrogen regulation response regulator GlnG/two-component system response regulator HydG